MRDECRDAKDFNPNQAGEQSAFNTLVAPGPSTPHQLLPAN